MNHWLCIAGLVLILCSCEVSTDKNISEGRKENTEVVTINDSLDTGDALDTFQKLVKDFESPERNEWQHPELILASLGDLKGKIIADIGAGTGYFTFKIAQKGAKVLAVDIDDQFLDYIEERKAELDHVIAYDMVETILAREDDPLLPINSVDGVLLVNTYHFLENRIDYMQKVKNAIKNNGQVIVVDYKKGDYPVGPDDGFKISAQKVQAELEKAGFTDINLDLDNLEYQYLITAKK